MHNEFTAVFERDGEWYVAYLPLRSGSGSGFAAHRRIALEWDGPCRYQFRKGLSHEQEAEDF